MKHTKLLICLPLGVILALLLAAWAHPFAGRTALAHEAPENFNGDAYADLVVGVPYEAIGSETSAGAAHVLYGSETAGLAPEGNQLWYQAHGGITETAETGDEFGFALAIADFNGDDYPDLAVGAHGESVGDDPAVERAGAVHILYGTASGLSADNNQIWHQKSDRIQGVAETDDRFGYALAAGDFNGDSYADLAVSAFWEDVGDPVVTNAGAVHVLYGSTDGLTADGNQLFYQGANGVQDTAEADDMFGSVLATGDFDGDGYADLAVGVPFEDVGATVDAGAVEILFGSSTGLLAVRDFFWHQDSSEAEDDAETNDQFAHALATGDLNGDGRSDLVVGVPYEDVGDPAINDAGAIQIFYGAVDSGLTANDDVLLHQDVAGVGGVAEESDWFGWSLACGDFDGNRRTDVAVGVPLEDVGDPVVNNAGVVQVLSNIGSHVSALWYQGNNDLVEIPENGDRFGFTLASGDFNGDDYADLAVGVPLEDAEGVDPLTDAGVVQVIYGSGDGLSADGNQLWHQDSTDIGGAGEDGDQFGLVLAALPSVRDPFKIYLPITVR